jgi:hypothetical protein
MQFYFVQINNNINTISLQLNYRIQDWKIIFIDWIATTLMEIRNKTTQYHRYKTPGFFTGVDCYLWEMTLEIAADLGPDGQFKR